MDDSALILFAHGARGAAWAEPLERLRDELQRSQPRVRVELAFLELQEPDLPQTLARLAGEGVRRVHVVPVFWSRGAHVERDLPAIVAQFRARHPGVAVGILPALADLPGMSGFLARAIRGLTTEPPAGAH